MEKPENNRDFLTADMAVRRAFRNRRTRVLSVRFPLDTYEELRASAERLDTSMSAIVGYAVDLLLDDDAS